MKIAETFEVIDTHTEGEPTRILMWNKPVDGSGNALTAREYFRENYDYLRTAILHEPRGHSDQFGAVVMPAAGSTADFILFFTTTAGYLDMCGNATIGVSTALVELGIFKPVEPFTHITYDTPAGIVDVKVKVSDGKAESVTVVDVTSFYLGEKEVKVGSPLNRKIRVDLSFGGNFYAIVDSSEIDTEVLPKNIETLRNAGKAISKAVYEQARPEHPLNSNLNSYPLTMLTGKPRRKNSDYRNVVIFSDGSFDRSPCGTGTASRAALLYSNETLKVGDSFTHESINDTTFKCRIVGTEQTGPYESIIPEITGRAWITQVSRIVIDPTDPMKNGFLVR